MSVKMPVLHLGLATARVATPFLKHETRQNVVAGLAPARLPPHAHGETFLLLPTGLGDTPHPPFANFRFKNAG